MAVTALLALLVIPVALLVLAIAGAITLDVPYWLPPAVGVVLAGVAGAWLARARHGSPVATVLFGLGSVAVVVGLAYLLLLGLIDAVEGPGGV